MTKKLLVVFMMLFVAISAGFAERKADVQHPENMNSWHNQFPINDKNGKYNIVVEAEDQAGNITVAGPYNIYIDKESDLPVTGITNPVSQMRVPGNLNIVGTCIDDDKVSEVWLILDGDKDHPVKADGTEYWSYYLDTTSLLEGPHTIEAYGVDNGNPEAYKDSETGEINESKIKPKTGHSVKVTWQLDRRAPVIEINADNHYMGELVRGKINLEGKVTDGNGINQLEYSTDGGKYYTEAKIKEVKLKTPDENGNTAYWTFSVPIDTKKLFDDGAATCWFKATDKAGSVAKYAFLFFVDNTNPEIVIVSPKANEAQNGLFTIAGYAYDANNISEVTWEFGGAKGKFELTPGNPYFVKEFDSRGKAKSEILTITATDTMGNVAVKKQAILIDQEADKPVVEIKYPVQNVKFDSLNNKFYIRGIAKDDDGVIEVRYSVDNGPEKVIETNGVFYADIEDELNYGLHSVSVYAVDKFGLKGNTVKNNFLVVEQPPKFGEATYRTGKEGVAFVNGMPLNPEANGSLEIAVAGAVGAKYVLSWGKDETIEGQAGYSGTEKAAVLKVPLFGENFPWGVVGLTVTAINGSGKQSVYKAILNLTDLTKPHTEKPGVYFTDSFVEEDGAFMINGDDVLSGYFVGGKIASVSIDPVIKGVNVSFSGNSISVTSKSPTPEFTVRVNTTSKATYTSRKLYFKTEGKLPVLKVEKSDSADNSIPLEFATARDKITISGTAESADSVKYRTLGVKVIYDDNGVVTGSETFGPTEFKDLPLNRQGKFSTDSFTSSNFEDGLTILEFVASNAAGSVTSAVFVKKITEIPQITEEGPDGTEISKPAGVPSVPFVKWIKGNDYYGFVAYQGKIKETKVNEEDFSDRELVVVKYEDILADRQSRKITVTPDVEVVIDPKSKKPQTAPVYSSEVLAAPPAECAVEGKFVKIDDVDYTSGLALTLPNGAPITDGHTALFSIKTQTTITSVEYKISGESYAGGKEVHQDKLIPVPVEGSEGEYEVKIPLYDLPARTTNIEVTVKDSVGQKTFRGTIIVLRDYQVVDSEEKIYWFPVGNVFLDESTKAYILNDGESLYGLANVSGPITASVTGGIAGLKAETEGNLVKFTAVSDGTYKDVAVSVDGEDLGKYVSPKVSIIADTSKPELTITGFSNMSFVGNKIPLKGTAKDGNGIKSVEYAIKDVATSESEISEWIPVSVSKSGAFDVSVDITESPDGYIPMAVRATDTTGKVTVQYYSLFKDVTPPEVKVLLPVGEMFVTSKKGIVNEINGENDIVFSVKDNSGLTAIKYISADAKKKSEWKIYSKAEEVPVMKNVAEDGTETPVDLKFDQLRTMNSSLPNMRIGTADYPHDNKMVYEFVDAAGNVTSIKDWEFMVNEDSDKPRVEIHLPADNQVITTDFTISGVIYDDDGPCKFFYKIDDGEWETYDNGLAISNFKVDRKLSSVVDNEHTITAYALDQNGVKGDEVTSKFRVSLEEPKGNITAPDMTKTVSGTITLKGVASDKNGISKVQISVDNGATYNDATGTTEWSYTFDTRVIQDGTHVVFLKIWDGYDITGLFTTLINIDNTPPELKLELPLDDSRTSKDLFFSGQTTDNIGLTSLYITIRSLENKTIPEKLAKRNLIPSEIISERVDLSSLNDGFYNIELTGTDAAGNITRVSRNIQLDKTKPLTKVDLLYPLNGEHMQGEFNIYGTVESEVTDPVTKLQLYLDGELLEVIGDAAVTSSGYYKFHLSPSVKISHDEKFELTAGLHTYVAVATTASGKTISSNEQNFVYNPYGPWVTLDNFTYGDFAVNRPLLSGKAGYILSEEEKNLLKAKDTPSEVKKTLELKKIKQVYISFNNGKTYEPVSKENKGVWSYRVENFDIPAGYHFMLIKAEMWNGENAITRTIVQVDRTAPSIKLISPGEGGHYNQLLNFNGLSSDDIALKNVTLSLRKGDKASYEIPAFIQGLYLDANVWGASLYSVGIGLTAFDNAVKIQGQFGQFTKEQRYMLQDLLGKPRADYRFGGNIFGAKIIAQVGYIPFRYFFGRDWDWLSATVSVGANFSYFSDSGASIVSGKRIPQIISCALAQVEFPRVTFANAKAFKTWSFYVEPQVWFIPSDVAGGNDAKNYKITASGGIRTTIF